MPPYQPLTTFSCHSTLECANNITWAWGVLGPNSIQTKHYQEELQNMKIRPLYDRIVVKRIEEQETIRGGIIIPDSAKEKPQEGEVIAVGNGKRLEDGKLVALDVKV